jgi:hypothetical protein
MSHSDAICDRILKGKVGGSPEGLTYYYRGVSAVNHARPL